MKKPRWVRRTPDVNLLVKAFTAPGIDPRTWVSLAVIGDVEIDPDEGIFADVTLLPSRIRETARIPGSWASGDGCNVPFDTGDEVIVGVPSGDFAAGLVVLGRNYSPADKPSKLAVDNPDCITVNSKRKMIVQLHDGAELVVQSVKTGDDSAEPGKITIIGKDVTVAGESIHLGGDTGLEKVARKHDPVSTAIPTEWAAWFNAIGAFASIPAPNSGAGSWSGTIADGSSVVKSK